MSKLHAEKLAAQVATLPEGWYVEVVEPSTEGQSRYLAALIARIARQTGETFGEASSRMKLDIGLRMIGDATFESVMWACPRASALAALREVDMKTVLGRDTFSEYLKAVEAEAIREQA